MFCVQVKSMSMAWFSRIRVYFMRYTQAVATAGIASVAAACFYSQTLGLRQYKWLMAQYKDDVESPVDSETLQLIEKVSCSVGIKRCPAKTLQFYQSIFCITGYVCNSPVMSLSKNSIFTHATLC